MSTLNTVAPLQNESLFRWEFGGPLGGLPPEQAWQVIAAVAVGGAVWILASYMWTLVKIGWAPRLLLAGLRCGLLLLLLAVLAGPTRIERNYVHREKRPLAVLVDRSESMTAGGARGQRRLDDALRQWRQLAPAAGANDGGLRAFTFADGTAEVATAETETMAMPAGQTRLFRALDHVLANAPAGGWAGVVTLTDGLDTGETDGAAALASTARAAVAAGTPLYFVAGYNEEERAEQKKPFITWRDLTAPVRVRPNSKFAIELTVESYQTKPWSVPVRVRVGDAWREAPPFFVNAGRRVGVWRTEIQAEAPGPLMIEVQAGEGDRKLVALARVQVVAPKTAMQILHYQGALDWGQRFLIDILRRDPEWRVLGAVTMRPDSPPVIPAALGAPRPIRLPQTAANLAGFDAVVLAGASPAQFQAKEQAALTEWVRQGGSLLFLSPDAAAAAGFAGTELERLLPVVFAPADGAGPASKRRAGSAQRAKTNPLKPGPRSDLTEFAWEPGAGEIFGSEGTLPRPRFASYVPVLRAKPGAVVIARHPRENAPGREEPAILLAWQRFGRGRTAIMTCDSLWRWKMQEPSGSHDVERFWQQLFAWLARQPERELRFEQAPVYAEVGQPLALRVAGKDSAPTTARALLSREKFTDLATDGPAQDGVTTYRWTPPEPGLWQLAAQSDNGELAQHWVTVRPPAKPEEKKVETGERSGRPPDVAALQNLARRTGGALLDERPPAAWTTGEKERTDLVSEQRVLLWHHRNLFALLAGLYTLELLLRRWQRLL